MSLCTAAVNVYPHCALTHALSVRIDFFFYNPEPPLVVPSTY